MIVQNHLRRDVDGMRLADVSDALIKCVDEAQIFEYWLPLVCHDGEEIRSALDPNTPVTHRDRFLFPGGAMTPNRRLGRGRGAACEMSPHHAAETQRRKFE
jgi:hypothetical protein